MTCPTLTTNRLQIRAFTKLDLQAFVDYRNQPDVARYQSWESYSIDQAQRMLDGTDYHSFGTEAAIGNWYQLAIVDKHSDLLFGDIAVHFVDAAQVEIGFTLACEHQGKGIATEAVSKLLEHLFVRLNKHRIVATTDVLNHPSNLLLERLGFRREAHFIQNIFFKGAWGDEYQYALLRSESGCALQAPS